MADNELKITLDAAKQLKEELRNLQKDAKVLDYQFRQNQISAEELAKGLGDIRTKAQELTSDQRKLVDVEATLYQVQQRSSVGFKSLAVDMNALKFKTDSTTEELRRFYREQRIGDRTMREATSAMGGFGSMLGSEGVGKIVGVATQRFQEMEFAVHGVGIAAQSGSPKIASLGEKLIGMAGPLAGGAAAVGLFTMALTAKEDALKRFHENLDKINQQLIALGRIGTGNQLNLLNQQLDELSKTSLKPSLWTFFGGLGRDVAIIEYMNKILELSQKLLDIETKRAALGEKESLRRFKDVVAAYDKEVAMLKVFNLPSAAKGLRAQMIAEFTGANYETITGETSGGTALTAGAQFRGLAGLAQARGAGGVRGRYGEEKTIQLAEPFKEANKDAVQLGNTMENAFSQATSALADEFSRTFGLADNLAGQFFATVLSGISQMLAMKATGGLLDLLGLGVTIAGGGLTPTAIFAGIKTITAHASGDYWFNEPTFAVGMKTGQRHIIAEREPEYLAGPMSSNRMGQAGRYGASNIIVQPVIYANVDRAGISVLVEQGNRINRGRRI